MSLRRRLLLTTVVLTVGSNATAGVYIYPRNGQSAERQEKDQYECYRWAKAQSGVDPAKAGAPGEHARGAVRGALGGALAGAAVGEIADDEPGKGAAIGAGLGAIHGRRQAKQQATDGYGRAFAVCMDARGYSVK